MDPVCEKPPKLSPMRIAQVEQIYSDIISPRVENNNAGEAGPHTKSSKQKNILFGLLFTLIAVGVFVLLLRLFQGDVIGQQNNTLIVNTGVRDINEEITNKTLTELKKLELFLNETKNMPMRRKRRSLNRMRIQRKEPYTVGFNPENALNTIIGFNERCDPLQPGKFCENLVKRLRRNSGIPIVNHNHQQNVRITLPNQQQYYTNPRLPFEDRRQREVVTFPANHYDANLDVHGMNPFLQRHQCPQNLLPYYYNPPQAPVSAPYFRPQQVVYHPYYGPIVEPSPVEPNARLADQFPGNMHFASPVSMNRLLHSFPSLTWVPHTPSAHAVFENGRHHTNHEVYTSTISSLEATTPRNTTKLSRQSDCPSGTVQCDDGECLEESLWCNGLVECENASDEARCSCRSRIDKTRICDEYFDCPFGEDELGCAGCKPHEFSCDDHGISQRVTCFRKEQRCNNVVECPNRKDELECEMLTPSLHEKPEFAISQTEGFLHRNFKGRWYPVCENPYMWAESVCFRETGLLLRAPLVHLVHVSPTYRGSFVTHVTGDVIQMSSSCFNSSAVYVTCPDMMCGTRIKLTTQSLHEDFNNENNLFGRNKRVAGDYFDPYNMPFEENALSRPRRLEGRVVGGKPSEPASWPWMIAMYRDGSFHCGGVLLSKQWVVSAAHCVHSYWDHYYEVQVGMLRRFSFSPQEHNHKISHIIVNKFYDKHDMKNDLSLLRLETPVMYSRWVRPICLPGLDTAGPNWKQGPQAGTMCVAVGWGATAEHGADPDHLREVEVPVLSDCKHREDRAGHELCAGFKEGGKDACQGDSGGPLLCRNPLNVQQWYMAGIVSHGEGCARKGEPGVYTRVSLFVDWIRFNIASPNLPMLTPLQECPGFRCYSGISKCLPRQRTCDRIVDCLGGEDEQHCETMKTAESEDITVVNPTTVTDHSPNRTNFDSNAEDKEKHNRSSSKEESEDNSSEESDKTLVKNSTKSHHMAQNEKPSFVFPEKTYNSDTTSTKHSTGTDSITENIRKESTSPITTETVLVTTTVKHDFVQDNFGDLFSPSRKLEPNKAKHAIGKSGGNHSALDHHTEAKDPEIKKKPISNSRPRVKGTGHKNPEVASTDYKDYDYAESEESGIHSNKKPSHHMAKNEEPIFKSDCRGDKSECLRNAEENATTSSTPIFSSSVTTPDVNLNSSFESVPITNNSDIKPKIFEVDLLVKNDSLTTEPPSSSNESLLNTSTSTVIIKFPTTTEQLVDKVESKIIPDIPLDISSTTESKPNSDKPEDNPTPEKKVIIKLPPTTTIATHSIESKILPDSPLIEGSNTTDRPVSENPEENQPPETKILPSQVIKPPIVLTPAIKRKTWSIPKNFHCRRMNQTILYDHRCDRKPDCEDGTDEMDCNCGDYVRSFNPKLQCDGIVDCLDGMDEADCTVCTKDQFLCKSSSSCLPYEYVCDGNPNCPKGEDELDCFALSNGEYLTFDMNGRPHVNIEGYLTIKKKHSWSVVCEENANMNDSEQESIATNICHYLGFSDFFNYKVKHFNVRELRSVNDTNERSKRAFSEAKPVKHIFRTKSSDDSSEGKEKHLEPIKCLEATRQTCISLYVQCSVTLKSDLSKGKIEPGDFSKPFDVDKPFEHKDLADERIWPWLAKIFVEGEYRCSGVLIDFSWVMLHHGCLWNTALTEDYVAVVLGMNHVLRAATGANEQTYRVDGKKDLFDTKVTLLHLENPAIYSRYVRPMIIPSSNMHKSDHEVCVALGADKQNNTSAVFLEEVDKDCGQNNRCFVRHDKDKCIQEDSSQRPWRGIISCVGEGGWFPAATFVEQSGACGFQDEFAAPTISHLRSEIKGSIMFAWSGEQISTPPCIGARCSRGACIPMSQVCDGVQHCEDHADESPEACSAKQRFCRGDELSRHCACAASQLKCQNGRCISKELFANGVDDCGDKSDEPSGVTCGQYLSHVQPQRLCDGNLNCADRTDEDPAFCKCYAEKTFRCYDNLHCVSNDMVCDGIADCPDGEDERVCTALGSTQDEPYGVGEVIIRRFGIWQTKCYPSPKHTKADLENICSQLGFNGGHAALLPADKPTMHLDIATDPFEEVTFNSRTRIFLRNSDEPLARSVEPNSQSVCFPLRIECY